MDFCDQKPESGDGICGAWKGTGGPPLVHEVVSVLESLFHDWRPERKNDPDANTDPLLFFSKKNC